ncbi:MAG TPA: phage holin family protein [Puia sp.]|nr:phage holin family protein [Puia sp.]
MEEFVKFENLIGHTRDYLNTRVDEAKLTVAERSSAVIARIIALTVVSVVFGLCLIFASVAAAWWLGHSWGRVWLGFLAVAGIYFIAGLIVWSARERLIRIPIMNSIIHQLFKTEDDEDD